MISRRSLLLLSTAVLLLDVLAWTSAFQPSSSQTAFSRYYYDEQTHGRSTTTTMKGPLYLPQPHDNHNPFVLSVAAVPQEKDKNTTEAAFFFRAPFPAQTPVIPSELTDDTALAQAEAASIRAVPWEPILNTYWGPRIILVMISIVYATNFPLGAIMAGALPASAATSSRMFLAMLALSPFLTQIKPHLRWPAILCGCGTALGYVTQSLALVDTDPSKVSFLGAATVLWCPFLEWVVEKKEPGPQTWLAAILCMFGVGVLELYQPGAVAAGADVSTMDLLTSVHTGDLLALVQAVGFGTGCFLSARMVQKEPDQVMPITATLVATSALMSGIWALTDGWMFQPGGMEIALPGLFFADGFQTVAMAVVWTGLISTSFNFVIEISALGRVPPSEASVLLASEPLWAAILAATVFHQSEFGANDYVGGACILLACLANAVLKPEDFQWLLGPSARKVAEAGSDSKQQ